VLLLQQLQAAVAQHLKSAMTIKNVLLMHATAALALILQNQKVIHAHKGSAMEIAIVLNAAVYGAIAMMAKVALQTLVG
jgi:hypothetical protein